MSVSPRVFAAVVGGLMLLVGLIFLLVPVEVTRDVRLLGTFTDPCGNALSGTDSAFSGDLMVKCDEAIGTRRAWTFPLAGVGLLVLAGAGLVRLSNAEPAAQPE